MRQTRYSVPQLHVLSNQVPRSIQQWDHICPSLLLVTCVFAEALLGTFDIPCQIQLQMWALALLTMHAQMVSLYSFNVTRPCFHTLYASFLYLSFARNSLFIHADLLAFLLDFLLIKMDCS